MQKVLEDIRQSSRANSVLCLFAGALAPLAFAPFKLWFLSFISPALLYYLSKELNTKETLKNGWLFGLGFFGIGTSWIFVSIHEFGYLPAPFAALLTFLFCAGLAILFAIQNLFFKIAKLDKIYLFSFPALWVIFEWTRTWLFTGFPWIFLGYAHIESPLSTWTPILGVFGLSYIVVFLGLLIISFILEAKNLPAYIKQPQVICATVLAASILLVSPIISNHEWVTIDKKRPLNVALIQGNISQHDKWAPESQQNILEVYGYLMLEAWEQEQLAVDLLVLPEAAMPTFQSHLKDYLNQVDLKAKENNSAVFMGVFHDKEERGFYSEHVYNSVASFGLGQGLYHKQHLVPFTEMIPLQSLLKDALIFFNLPYSAFAKGGAAQENLITKKINVAPFICYELLFPYTVYQQAKPSDILLTISNDAWFGTSTGPKQHFQMTRMRALELGKYLIRSTNNGTTAIVDYKGKVLEAAPKYQREILYGTVYPTIGKTPYAHYGPLPVIMFSIFILTLSFLASKVSAQRET